MRPAGMSSDEDEDDDDYFSMSIPLKRSNHDEKPKVVEYLPPDHSQSLRTLLDQSSKISLFHKAAEERDFRQMEELLGMDVSVDDSKINQWTPLMTACSDGKPDVVRFLLEKGAKPNLHKELFTPLMACCTQSYIPEEDRLECVRLLIQYGANVNATDKHKTTALMMATNNGLNEIFSELLNSPDIDIKIEDKEGWNVLFYAAHSNNKFAIEKLLNAGISINTMNKYGQYSAVELAEMKNNKEIVKILKQHKGEPVQDETIPEPVVELTFNSVRHYYQEFLDQFPDENGRGGFSKDVRDIFAGVGLSKLYDKLKPDVPFPDILVGNNLTDMGVKFEPMRRKLQGGIHRYHLAPWAKGSLYPLDTIKELEMTDYISAMSNVTKHLAIMYATLEYVRSRLSKWEGKTHVTINREILDLLITSYVEVQKTKKLLWNISAIAGKIKPTEEVEADYIGKMVDDDQPKTNWKRIAMKAGIAGSVIYIIYKFRFSPVPRLKHFMSINHAFE